MADYKVLNKQTGKLETLPEEQADALVASRPEDYEYPDAATLQSQEDKAAYGDQAGLASLEQGVRTATFGAVPGFGSEEEIAGRERYLRDRRPLYSMGAQTVGALAPAVLGGGLVGGAAELAGLGARTVGGLTSLAEAGLGGTADEVEQARYEDRPISVSNIVLSGALGEIAGRGLPAAARKLSGLGKDALERVESSLVDEGADVLSRRARVMEARSVDDAVNLAPGPERESFLRDTSKQQYQKIAERADQNISEIRAKVDELTDLKYSRNAVDERIPETSRLHDDYRSMHAQSLKNQVDNLEALSGPGTEKAVALSKKVLKDAYTGLDKADSATDIFLSNVRAQNNISGLIDQLGKGSKLFDGADDAVRTKLLGVLKQEQSTFHNVLNDKSLFADASDLYSDIQSLKNSYREITGQSESAFGRKPTNASIQDYLKNNPDSVLPGYSDLLDRASDLSKKYNMGDRAYFDKSSGVSAGLRKESALANELRGITPTPETPAPNANDFVRSAIKDAAVDYGLGVLAGPLGPVGRHAIKLAGKAMQSAKIIDRLAPQSVKSSARSFLRPRVSQVRGVLETIERGSNKLRYSAGPMRSALSRFQGDHPDARSSYEAKRDTLAQISSDPSIIHQGLVSSLGGLFKDNPRLAQDISTRFVQNLNYIQDNLPPALAASIQYPDGLPASQSTIRDFAVLWNSVMDPMTVVEDLGNRTVSPVQLKYLKDSNKDIYDSLKEEVQLAIADNYANIPVQAKKQMDILFESDGMAGPAFSSRAARYMEEALAANAQKTGNLSPNAGKPLPASNLQFEKNIKTSVSNYSPA